MHTAGIKRAITGLILSFALNQLCYAQKILPPVIVSAARTAHSAVTTPASISLITREEIRASGARHIVDVLRGRGSVQVSDLYGDGSRARVSMRGFGGNAHSNVLVLVDGRRLNNTDIADPDLNSIALKDVEQIEIIQGSSGVLFGDQAVGGVINIITRRPDEYRTDLVLGGGSFSQRYIRVGTTNRINDRLDYRISAESRAADNFRDNNHQDYTNALVRVDYQGTARSVFLEHQLVDENSNLPGSLFADQLDRNRKTARFPADFADTRTNITRVGLHHDMSQAWRLEAEVSRRSSAGKGALFATPFQQDRTHVALTPRLVGSIAMGEREVILTAGIDLDESDYFITSTLGTTDNDQSMRSAYLQGVADVDGKTSITTGIRYAEMENELVDSGAFPTGTKLSDDLWVSEIGLTREISPSLRIFVRRDENYRFAKVDEYTFTDPARPPLQTQTGTSYEGGLEWVHAGTRAKGTLFRLDLEDEIDFDPSAFFGFGANANLENTRRDGLILEAGRSLGPMHISAHYTYLDAKFHKGMYQGNHIPMVARDALRLGADYRFKENIRFYGEGLYIGERFAEGDYANSLQKLSGHTVFNLHAKYQQAAWTLSARINNLTDKRYNDAAAQGFSGPLFTPATGFYPAPERNLSIEIAYALD